MSALPDLLELQPLAKPPDCTVTIPGSKSITNRALILAALADQTCTLRGALWADDTQVMVAALRTLGFAVEVAPDPAESANRTITVTGQGGVIPARHAELFVGNAGTAARFLTALVSRGTGEYRLHGDPRMHQRPMGELFHALGIDGDHLPVTIRANGGPTGPVRVSGAPSSQFASALMLAGYAVETGEHAYVEMTRRMVAEFQPDYRIEPDLSSASYFVAAQFLSGGQVRVADWPANSLQVDGRFPQCLPPPRIVSRQRDLGDSVMTLAMCAVFGEQPLTITEAGRLRDQECDRISALVTELRKVGARAEETADSLTVYPARIAELHGADIETYNDHRMAMCFAALGLRVPGLRLKNPGCVRKTFPNFFEKWEQLRQ